MRDFPVYEKRGESPSLLLIIVMTAPLALSGRYRALCLSFVLNFIYS